MHFFQANHYQERCQKLFEKYKRLIQATLPHAQIEHIGSSAITNAISKGDLDIYVAVSDVDASIRSMETIGFEVKKDTYRSAQLCMLESKNNDDVAIQLTEKGSEFEDFLLFRDRLNVKPELVELYNQLKRDCTGITMQHYREIKSKFIETIIAQNYHGK